MKSLLAKLDSLNPPAAIATAEQVKEPIQLTESAQMRVLSGLSTIVVESKKTAKKEEVATEEVELEKDEEETELVKEASEAQAAAREKFKSLVSSKKKSTGKEKAPAKEKAETKTTKKDGKQPPWLAKGKDAKAKVTDKPVTKKKTVKESVEHKLTFKQLITLVQESGGQQRIDATDADLFAWAQRVACNKFTESAKQEIYAGLVYERMGGSFEMYDILSEDM